MLHNIVMFKIDSTSFRPRTDTSACRVCNFYDGVYKYNEVRFHTGLFSFPCQTD
jgi:hypothetical protein